MDPVSNDETMDGRTGRGVTRQLGYGAATLPQGTEALASQLPAAQLEGAVASPGGVQPPSQRRRAQDGQAPAGGPLGAPLGNASVPLGTAELVTRG